MKYLLLLLCLAASSFGLQKGHHYEYEYYGSIFSGIPELSDQAAGWAMKANVHVYIEKDDGVALFQLENFKMVEYNGHLGCDVRGDVPDELFHPIENEILSACVQAPFKVHLFDHKENYVIEYEAEPFLWLTNMRKGIASMFRTEILKGNIDSQIEGSVAQVLKEGKVINTFSVSEETIFGHCKVDYSLHRIPAQYAGVRNNELKSHMEADCQTEEEKADIKTKTTKKSPRKYRGKTSKTGRKTGGGGKKSPKPTRYFKKDFSEDLWHVTRSVDFDHCDERVSLQITPIGIKESISKGQYEWGRGRSSVSEYIFRGSPGKARIEKAIVEGATAVAPMGLKTEIIQARVNQTLQLVKVTCESKNKFPVMGNKVQHSNTWMQEVWSFAEPPTYSKPHPWVVYTGKGEAIKQPQIFGISEFSDDSKKPIKSSIINYIEEASLLLTDLDQEKPQPEGGETLHYIETTSHLIPFLSKDEICEIFDYFFEKKLHDSDDIAKKLIIDAAAASGACTAMEAIVQYLSLNKIPEVQILTISMTLTNNAKCPSIIPPLMDYVLSLDPKEKPLLAPSVLINFAEFMNHMCVDPQSRKIYYAGPLYGDHGCARNMVKDRFVPYLRDMIYNGDTEPIQKTGIMALNALGTPYSFKILAPIIEGKIECHSNRVRALAIYALDSFKLSAHGTIREQVLDLLANVYGDIGQAAEVREAALVTAAFWKPGTSFWHYLARTTWREPSKGFATWASALIESFATLDSPMFKKESQAASFALKFAKPVFPVSSLSYILQLRTPLHDRHVSLYEVISWHVTNSNPRAIELYYILHKNMGGFHFSKVEFALAVSKLGVQLPSLELLNVDKQRFDGIPARIAEDAFEKLLESLHKENHMPRNDKVNLEFVLRLCDHMGIYIPYQKGMEISDDYAMNLAAQLVLGNHNINLGKYLTPIDALSAHPTELGLPLIVKTRSPTVMTQVSYTSLVGGDQLSVESFTNFATEGHTSVNVLLPWNQVFVGAGVRATREITLPLKISGKYDFPEEKCGSAFKTIQIDIQSYYKKKFSVARARNIPYTAIMPAIPVKNEPHEFKRITQKHPRTVNFDMPGTYTGLHGHFRWTSEMAFPVNLWNLKDFICDPILLLEPGSIFLNRYWQTPTTKYWEGALDFDPETSETKTISIQFSLGTFGKSIGEYTGQETQSTGQETQETADYTDNCNQIGQESQQSQDYGQFGDIETFNQGFEVVGGSPEVEVNTNIGSLPQRSEKMSSLYGSPVSVKGIKVLFDGVNQRSYEVSYTYATSTRDQKTVKKSQLSFIRSPIPNVYDKQSSICLDFQKSTPVFSELDTVKSLMAMDIGKEMKAEVTLGCKGDPVVVLRGSYHLSDHWKKKLQEDIPHECDFDVNDPLHIVSSHAIYDDLKYTLTWEKVCDSKKYPITTKLFDAVNKIMNIGLLNDRCNEVEAEHKLELEAHRCPKSENWFVDIKRGDSELHFKEIPHNEYLHYALAITKRDFEIHDHHNSLFNLESSNCVVGIDSVRTFDGFTYTYDSSECWTVAAMAGDPINAAVLVRSPSTESSVPDVKYIDRRHGVVAEYANHVLKVNGKVIDPHGGFEAIKNEKGDTILTVHKKNDFYMVYFSENFYIAAKDKIIIHNNVMESGLCGNHDQEPEGELVGPRGCVYEDPKLFASSWAIEGDGCNLYELLELQKDVEKFQKKCIKMETIKNTCPNFNERCTKLDWLIRETGNDVCVTSSPFPHCLESCNISETHYEMIDFRCWPVDHAPAVLKPALKEGLNYTSTLIEQEPYSHTKLHMPIPTYCKKLHGQKKQDIKQKPRKTIKF